MKKIMILGASVLQLPAIQKAKEMGLQVIAVDMNPEAIGFEVEGVISEVISTIDIEKVLEAAKKHDIDGIMTLASDMPMRTVAVVAKELGLVGITEDTAVKATNKAVMRVCLEQNDVPVPRFYKVHTKEECLKAVNQFSVDCIIKPADNSGSRGVFLINDTSDVASVEHAYEYSKQYSRSGDIVVEEYMTGPEVSVETLCVNGECHVIQITDKLTTGAPNFVEMGHSQPSLLSQDTCEKIKEVAIAANYAVGIQNGPSHTEIKVTPNGPKIVEIGARLGGDNITTHLVPLSTGIDMVEACINIALGEEPNIKNREEKASAIRYFKNDIGVIQSIEGIQEAKQIPGVKQISIVHDVGSLVGEIHSSVDRVGFVIAQADNQHDAIEICEKALQLIKINVTKE